MASTAQNYLNSFTVSNQGIEELSELLMLTHLKTGSINEVVDVMYGVRQGKRLGGIGEFGTVGESQKLCKPTFNATNLATQEKVWDLGAVGIYESLCADDFLDTIVQFSMGTGTDKADLTNDELMSLIIEPKLAQAWDKAIWRTIFFGDKDAQSVSSGGNLTNDANSAPKFFNMFDGLFKRMYEIVPTDDAQHVAIPANAGATYDAQMENIFDFSDPTTTPSAIVNRMIYRAAPYKLRQQTDRVLLVTQSFADALAEDIKTNNKGSDLQWESLFDGLVSATKFNGQTIMALPVWDEMIRTHFDNGTKWLDPHRAVYTTKSNLKAGIASTDLLATLDIWFSKDEQDVKILARDEMGTMVWEDDILVFAY